MTTIHVLDKKVELLQHDEGFKTSIDAVLLAAACPIKAGESFLDLGCGVGSAAFCVLKRVKDTNVTGIDILPEVVVISQKNALLNKVKARTHFKCIDIRDFENLTFDHVISNPPYLEADAHLRSPSEAKATAMGFGEDDIDLKDWLDCAYRSIKGQGSLTMIHRADMVDEIIRTMGKRFGAIEIIPLWPKAGRESKRVIVRARKNRKSGATLHPGVILHQADGAYSLEAQKILRQGHPLI